MQIRTTTRHFDLSEDLKKFSEEEINRLSRYFDRIIDCHLILEEEKKRRAAELKVKVYGTVLTSKYKSYDMRNSVEKVIDKMEAQIKKYKSKLKDKKPKKATAIKSRVEIQRKSEEEEEL